MSNMPPTKIKHKGYTYVRAGLYRTADLSSALQSDVLLINQVMKALQAGNLDEIEPILSQP